MKDELRAYVKGELERYRLAVEGYIIETSEERAAGVPGELFESMEYSLRAGGKRLRPALCLAAAKRAGVDEEKAMPMALGLEMLHTATLIHDDLPCMDDDDMRRGKPSNHAKFGETLALLAGDALFVQSLEFPMAKLKGIAPANVLRAMHIFAKAIGPSGVCGGQVLDIDAGRAGLRAPHSEAQDRRADSGRRADGRGARRSGRSRALQIRGLRRASRLRVSDSR